MDNLQTVDQLEDRLSQPTPGLLDDLRKLPGDLLILGVGGKIGPSLARMARRALDQLGRKQDRVIGVDKVIGMPPSGGYDLTAELKKTGIVPVACDLLDRQALAKLPDAPNIIFLAGMKFGTAAGPELTWAMNTLVPAHAAERYPKSRFVVFSTGCVYPFVPVTSGGSVEEDPAGPPGDYANSCVGRERIFTFFSKKNQTPVTIFRLNYAIDLRYGLLCDLAQKILTGETVDVTMGHVNLLWQRDVNARALQCLAHAASPPFILNVTGPETLTVRSLAERLGKLLGTPAKITGKEADTAWVSNAAKSVKLFGPPTAGIEQLLVWVAEWAKHGGSTLGKPTHFETRDGKF